MNKISNKINNFYILIFIILIIILFFYFINRNILVNFKIKEKFNNIETERSDKIPKIIIQTWKDNNVPNRYKKLVASIKEHNPDYEYLFFTDDDIEKFLQKDYPEYYETFLKLPVFIQKIDFFRYIAIYHYGGFYFDLDIECFKPFDDLLKYDSVFPIDTHIGGSLCFNPRFTSYCDNGKNFFVGQYSFGAKAKNEFIKILIDNIHNNIDVILEGYDKLQDKNNLDFVYITTGPDYVTKLYYEYPKNDSIKILHHGHGQFFGDFARHQFMGTWKGWV
jgi:mannosyltransferase OCH1-like enzyme